MAVYIQYSALVWYWNGRLVCACCCKIWLDSFEGGFPTTQFRSVMKLCKFWLHIQLYSFCCYYWCLCWKILIILGNRLARRFMDSHRSQQACYLWWILRSFIQVENLIYSFCYPNHVLSFDLSNITKQAVYTTIGLLIGSIPTNIWEQSMHCRAHRHYFINQALL